MLLATRVLGRRVGGLPLNIQPVLFLRHLSDSVQQQTFDKLFHDNQCHQIYTKPRLDRSAYVMCLEPVAIINLPTETLANDIITFDAARVADEAMSIATLPPDPRKKPVLGLVKGTGGGKTRSLEEVRWELLAKDGVLPLAFTFNSTMNFTPTVEFAWGTKIEVCYALSVVSRLLSVFYGMELSKVRSTLTRHSKLWGVGEDDEYPAELIRGCILHLASKAPFHVTTVVVLGDEMYLAEREFAALRRATLKRDLSEKEIDITGVLRSALLDVKIAPHLNTTLILSALTITAMGKSVSLREVVAFSLYPLNPHLVVTVWWKRPLEKAALLKVAAALADLPRGVEFAADYLQLHPDPVNAATIKALLEYVLRRFKSTYSPSFLSLAELRAVFFGELLDLNTLSLERVKHSLFTNSIVEFNTDDTIAKICPTVSLLLLAAGAGKDKTLPNTLLHDLLAPMSTAAVGDPLEWGVAFALQMRLALITGSPPMSMLQLMSLNGVRLNRGSESRAAEVGDGMLEKMAKASVHVSENFIQGEALPLSYDGVEEFIKALTCMEMVAGEAWVVPIHGREGFDHLLAVCDGGGEIFLVFIEDWSNQEKKKKLKGNDEAARERGIESAIQKKWSRGATPGHKNAGKQALRVAEDLVTAAKKADAPRGSVAHALGHKQYAYIFLSCRSNESYTTDHAIDLARTESERFLGPLWPVFQAVRGGMSESV